MESGPGSTAWCGSGVGARRPPRWRTCRYRRSTPGSSQTRSWEFDKGLHMQSDVFMHNRYKYTRQPLPFVTVPSEYPSGGFTVTYRDPTLTLYPYILNCFCKELKQSSSSVMAHTWMSHSTYMNESWHMYAQMPTRICCLCACAWVIWHLHESVMARAWISHGTYTNEAGHTHELFMARVCANADKVLPSQCVRLSHGRELLARQRLSWPPLRAVRYGLCMPRVFVSVFFLRPMTCATRRTRFSIRKSSTCWLCCVWIENSYDSYDSWILMVKMRIHMTHAWNTSWVERSKFQRNVV